MKTIEDYQDYAVSPDGDIYSLIYKNRFGFYTRKKPFKLRYNISNCGYCSVALGSQINNLMKRVLVHRIVAKAFIPNPENKPYVNHRNGIKTDNRVDNLEWVTQSENEIHAHATGLKNHKGDNAPYKKISQKIADDIRILCAYKTNRELAIAYGVDPSLISKIIHYKVW